jgi:hypothetical protein
MAERNPAKKDTQTSAKSTTATGKTFEGLTDEERAAMKERTWSVYMPDPDGHLVEITTYEVTRG